MENEAAALKFIAETTNVPVPRVHETFEKDGAFYIVMEKVPGIAMARLDEDAKEIVIHELEGHVQTLHSLRSHIPGGVSGIIVPPYRITLKTKNDSWKLKPATKNDFVFCHNDLSQHNVIVDPESLQIKAIIDWEYSGFYPEYFEGHFYTRPGPSVALGDENDDSEKLLSFLLNQSGSKYLFEFI
jgi:aminoglycoside phosphotransferase